MAVKKKACKQCGTLTTENKCMLCGNNSFVENFKGETQILDAENSVVAKKLEIEKNGNYAIRF